MNAAVMICALSTLIIVLLIVLLTLLYVCSIHTITKKTHRTVKQLHALYTQQATNDPYRDMLYARLQEVRNTGKRHV